MKLQGRNLCRFCRCGERRDQKLNNLKLQRQNLNHFFLRGLKPKFANITRTKGVIYQKKKSKINRGVFGML